MSRHRRPTPHPPPLARLNRWLDTRTRKTCIGLAAFGVLTFAVAGIATEHAPVARATPTATFAPVVAGPLAPVFPTDLNAPEPTATPSAARGASQHAPTTSVQPEAPVRRSTARTAPATTTAAKTTTAPTTAAATTAPSPTTTAPTTTQEPTPTTAAPSPTAEPEETEVPEPTEPTVTTEPVELPEVLDGEGL